jgi:integrase
LQSPRPTPFDSLRLPLLEKQEQPYFTAKRMRRIIRRAEEPYQTLYWLAAETGLRAGELAGLQWGDVKNGHIEVRRSVWGSKAQSPKTANGLRTFAISAELQARLESKRKPEGYVFATRNGTPWNMNDVPEAPSRSAAHEAGNEAGGLSQLQARQ